MFLSKVFKDKNGDIIVTQKPNLPIIIWFASIAFNFVYSRIEGNGLQIVSWLGSAALVVWALMEIFGGVNLFRRMLGAAALVVTLIGFVA